MPVPAAGNRYCHLKAAHPLTADSKNNNENAFQLMMS